MKRILTLTLFACAFSAANAQFRDNGNWNNGNGREVVVNNGPRANFPPNTNFGYNRQAEIDRVSRDYDVKIQSVWNDPYLHRGEKKRITRDLERERQFKIDEINRRCDAWERDHRYDRRNNDWHDGRH